MSILLGVGAIALSLAAPFALVLWLVGAEDERWWRDVIDTRRAEGRKDGYVLIAAPDWIQAMQLLFGEWTPDPEQRAIEAPDHGALAGHDR